MNNNDVKKNNNEKKRDRRDEDFFFLLSSFVVVFCFRFYHWFNERTYPFMIRELLYWHRCRMSSYQCNWDLVLIIINCYNSSFLFLLTVLGSFLLNWMIFRMVFYVLLIKKSIVNFAFQQIIANKNKI